MKKTKKPSEPTISFVCPCYNDGDSVGKFIDSILDQDLPGIEIIVVNDGSTDNSKEVLEAYAERGEIKFINLEKNVGACTARNIGAKEAKGKYLSFLPADAVLYPGMARIWYNLLEQNPSYDFLYGGYRLVDSEGEPIPGNEYFFEPFDPYMLETTNYIDGSFPIRREAFWKYAELMGQPDGLWDPNIKSLQDWDFWLSVVKHGGKGLYVQDIFFGTTAPHKGGLSDDSANNWIERTTAIKKKHGIPIRKLCVTSLGAGWHAKRVAFMLDADFKQMPSFKPHEYDAIYSIGFYPEFGANQDAIWLQSVYDPSKGRTSAKKIVHFVGSDIWQLYHIPLIHLRNVWAPYFNNGIDVVLAEDEFTQNELADLGIKSQVVRIPPATLYEVRPLPKDFTVACYLPQVNRDFYRPNDMIAIAKAMPDVKFKFFGNPIQVGKDPALPDNIEYVGYVTDMDAFITDCSAIMRFPLHDGLPLSVLEFLLAGRYSLQSVPVMHSVALQNFSVENAVAGIRQLQEFAKQGVNQVAADYWRKELDHAKYKETIYRLAGYDPKTYWESRAPQWADQAGFKIGPPEYRAEQQKLFAEELLKIKEVFEKVPHASTLDIGCGDGRFYPILKEWGVTDYRGVDISENLIKAAKVRFPEVEDRFFTQKLEDTPEPEWKYDVVFCYTTLQHVKDEDFAHAVETLKRIAHKAVIIEPTGFTSRYYSRSHDYEKAFNVIEKVALADKNIYLCDLQSA